MKQITISHRRIRQMRMGLHGLLDPIMERQKSKGGRPLPQGLPKVRPD